MKLKELFYQWEKKNNPFFPNEMKWDRTTIYKMIDDFENELVAIGLRMRKYKTHNGKGKNV